MTSETLSPAVDAIFSGDATGHIQFVVAGHADVVVASIALEAVVTGVGGRYRISTDVAERCEVERSEDEVCDGGVARSSTEGGRLGRLRRCTVSCAK